MDYKALIENGQELHHHGVKGIKKKAKQTYKKNKKAYKAAKLISKTRYKKRLKEAGGDFESYVKQQKSEE